MKEIVDKVRHSRILNGLDDYLIISEIHGSLKHYLPGTSLSELRELTLKMVEELLSEGIYYVGDIKRRHLKIWDMTVDDAMKRIKEEWPDDPDTHFAPEIYFQLTNKGVTVAKQLPPEEDEDE